MKIIISESQYKLLVEDKDDLISISDDVFMNKYKKMLMPRVKFKIKGSLHLSNFEDEYIEKILDKVIVVTEDFNCDRLSIESLGNLKYVGGDLEIVSTNITKFEKLEEVGGYLSLGNTFVESLGSIKKVGKTIYGGFNLNNLGECTEIGGNLNLYGSTINDLGKLKSVGNHLYLIQTEVKDFGKLESVGGDLFIMDSHLLKFSDKEIRERINVGGKIIRDGL